MKCRDFERLAADWVAGRLPAEAAVSMENHRSVCPACALSEAAERDLRGAFSALRETASAAPRELWPMVAARMEQPVPAHRFSFGTQRWAVGGALAAGALCAVLWLARTPLSPNPRSVPDESRVITMAAAIQELPDPDREFAGDASRHIPLLQRAVLVGGGDE